MLPPKRGAKKETEQESFKSTQLASDKARSLKLEQGHVSLAWHGACTGEVVFNPEPGF